MGSPQNPSPSAWTLGAVLYTDPQPTKVKEAEDWVPSVLYLQEAEIMK